ncbi:MAG TPA: outer membrane beta-barrel protein, partial [Terriglobales bacterium]
MHKLLYPCFALSILLLAPLAPAQVPGGNVYIGYSYVRADLSSNGPFTSSFSNSNLHGWNGSAEIKMLPWIGGVADFGGNYGTSRVTPFCEVIPSCPLPSFDVNTHVHTFLFGPRVSVSVGPFRPFAHVLIGAAKLNATTTAAGVSFSNSETTFTTAVGGGLDYRLVKGLAW